MEDALREVERDCPAQLRAFQACVDVHPDSWGVQCGQEKEQLTLCSQSVGVVAKVKEVCKPAVETYKSCLERNRRNYTEACLPALQALSECAESTSAAYARSSSPGSLASAAKSS